MLNINKPKTAIQEVVGSKDCMLFIVLEMMSFTRARHAKCCFCFYLMICQPLILQFPGKGKGKVLEKDKVVGEKDAPGHLFSFTFLLFSPPFLRQGEGGREVTLEWRQVDGL